MRTYNVSLEQCLVHVIKARPCIIPNDGFLKQLILYDRFLVERRRKQQEAALLQAINNAPPTEIPIQHHPSVPSQSAQPSISVSSGSSLGPPTDSASNPTHVSSVDSSSIGLSSTSSFQSSTSNNSIQVIPIQVASKTSSSDKVNLAFLLAKLTS